MPQYFSFNPTQPNPWMDPSQPTHVHLCGDIWWRVHTAEDDYGRSGGAPAAADAEKRRDGLMSDTRPADVTRLAVHHGKDDVIDE